MNDLDIYICPDCDQAECVCIYICPCCDQAECTCIPDYCFEAEFPV